MTGLRAAAKMAAMHASKEADEKAEAEKMRNLPMADLPTVPAMADSVLVMVNEIIFAKNLRQLLCTTLRIAHRLTTSLHTALFIVSEDDNSMLYIANPQDEHGNSVEDELETSRVSEVGPGIVGHVITSGETYMAPDAPHDLYFDPSVDRAPGYVVNSLLCAPVIGTQGRAIGAVQLCNKS